MFSTIDSPSRQAGRALAAVAPSVRPQRRAGGSQTLEEAYEMRLLAQVARCEDQAAFEEIYLHHRAAVMRVALQVCRDAGTAEEIAQHTFTALWARAGRLAEKSVRLRPWLTTVARNAAIDRVRAEEPFVAIDDLTDLPSRAASPEDAAIAAESKAMLAEALATLSPRQRRAIELVYITHLTYQAAAAELGEPVGTIKSRVRLGLGHLRAYTQQVSG